jgi:WD40 repeat protein
MWKIIQMSPGYSPIDRLSTAIAKTFTETQHKTDAIPIESHLNYALFTEKEMQIHDLIRNIESYEDENILIFVDQFEELFRYKEGASKPDSYRNEVQRFINLIMDAIQQNEVPIYLVICIRSDFLGECSNYQILTDYINKSHYLVPQMSRDDFKSVILGPLSYSGVKIKSDLLKEILDNLGNKADMLPVLQHLMMRMFNYWLKRGEVEKPIDNIDYIAVGKLKDAISIHAEEIYNQLSESDQQLCKKIFMTIAEAGPDNKGIRRPTTIKNICQIVDARKEQVSKVLDPFRSYGNSFITPAPGIELNEDVFVDISHESVMRNWDRLKKWIEEESNNAQLYLRLVEASELYQTGKVGTWKPPELTLALNWIEAYKPNKFWANQYHPAFNRSLKYLEISKEAYEAEIRVKENEQKQKIRRTRWFAAVLGFAALIALGLMMNSFRLKRLADRARNDAEEQRKLAEMNALEAEKQKTIALQYADELEVQKAIIEGKYETSEDQRETAVKSANEAIQQTLLAEQNLIEESKERELAEQSKQEALEQRNRAEEEQRATYRNNMILLAKNMSTQLLDIEGNPELKGLLAYQAYKFNKRNGGPDNPSYLYDGIKDALIAMDANYRIPLRGHTASVRSIDYNTQTGILYSGGSDGKLLSWDRGSDGTTPAVIAENNTINRIVVVSPNGRWLLCSAEGKGIYVYDIHSGHAQFSVLNAHQNRTRSIAFYSDGNRILTSGIDNTIMRWEVQSGMDELFYEAQSPVQSLAISKNDQYMAAGTKDGKLLLFRGGSSRPIVLFEDPGNQILSLAFHSKSNLLVCGDQAGILRFWSLNGMDMIYEQRMHQARIVDVKFSPDERFLATASTDGQVFIIDLETANQQPFKILSQKEFIFTVAFLNEGKHVFVGSNIDGETLSGFPFMVNDLASLICPNIERNITESEWAYYIGNDAPYEITCDDNE